MARPDAPAPPSRQPSPRRERLRGDRGGVSAFIMMLLPGLVGLAGLAFDGGMLFAGRREANNVAAAAARAGANDLLESSIYLGDPILSPTAPATARSFAFSQGAVTALATPVAPDRIEVTVTRQVDMTFLGIFGVGTQTVTGNAEAKVRAGVTG